MQNTRLNRLLTTTTDRLTGWVSNPWRRTSVLIISLLLGNFLASAVSTITGQAASLDVYVAAILTAICEVISRVAYRPQASSTKERRSLLLQAINTLKIGLLYGMFVEALKLGS
ncbi:MAG TPA: DUF565 domain-containing protein [Thermosynechococcaceae cyanobacterium]